MNGDINLKSVIYPIGLLLLSSNFAFAQKTSKSKKPNVLFILADDLGWNDITCMGSQYYETPNIDRLAKRGILFTNAYAACQVSSPSRASIMTGQYTPRHGITDWIGEKSGEEWRTMKRSTKLLPADYVRNLPKEEITLTECLKENGYTTFIAGKWHLGDEGSWPEDHGFDINKGGWSAGSPKSGYFTPYNNPKLTDGKPGENLTMRLAQETVSFIKNQQKKKSPFFAYLSFYAVHGPIQTTENNWKYFRDKAERMGIKETGFEMGRILPFRKAQDNPVYAGLIKQMDDAVGVVLDEIDKLGLDKNTMIIFTGDNGGVVSGDSYSTSLLPLRGGKGNQWEGGIREPLLIQYPGNKLVGTKCNTPVSGIDFYPTIIDYVNGKMDSKQIIDGVSIMPLLKGETIATRPLFWHYPHYGNQGGEPCSIIREGDWKLIYYHEDSRCELYNLRIDISESEPMNFLYPNKVKELKSKLDSWIIQVGAKMPKPDVQYSPQKEKERKNFYKTKVMQAQVKLRNQMLTKGWKPNKDWWRSLIIED